MTQRSPETVAAIHFNTGQIWDAMRSMRTAFLIDSNITPEPGITVPVDELPSWEGLTEVEQSIFVVMSARCAAHFAQAQDAVAQVHRKATS